MSLVSRPFSHSSFQLQFSAVRGTGPGTDALRLTSELEYDTMRKRKKWGRITRHRFTAFDVNVISVLVGLKSVRIRRCVLPSVHLIAPIRTGKDLTWV